MLQKHPQCLSGLKQQESFLSDTACSSWARGDSTQCHSHTRTQMIVTDTILNLLCCHCRKKGNVVLIYQFLRNSGGDRYHSYSYFIGQSKLLCYALFQAGKDIVIIPCFPKGENWHICDSFNDSNGTNHVYILFSFF